MILTGVPSSSFDGHYTITDIVLAVLVITPGLIVWFCIIFARPLSEAASSLAQRIRRRRPHLENSRDIRARKFESVGHSKWHGKN
jgi:hypothetical protein